MKDKIKKLFIQFMKFGVVGGAAFIIDYGGMILFTELFHIDYLVSATLSFALATIFNYIFSMRFVFAHKDSLSRRKEFAIFVVLSIIGLGINDGCMWLFTELFSVPYYLSKIIATAICTFYNFFSRKAFLDAGEDNNQE